MKKTLEQEIEDVYKNPKQVPMQTELAHPPGERVSPAMKARIDRIFQRPLPKK